MSTNAIRRLSVALSLVPLAALGLILPVRAEASYADGRPFAVVLDGQTAFDGHYAYWGEYAFDGARHGRWPKTRYQVRQRSLTSRFSRVLFSSTSTMITELHANAGRIAFSTTQLPFDRKPGSVIRTQLYVMSAEATAPTLLKTGKVEYPTPPSRRAAGYCGDSVHARDVTEAGDVLAEEHANDCSGTDRTELVSYAPSGERSVLMPKVEADQLKFRNQRILTWGEWSEGARMLSPAGSVEAVFRTGAWISELPTQGERIAAITTPETEERQQIVRFAPGTLRQVQRIRLRASQVGTLRFCDSGGFVVITGPRNAHISSGNIGQMLGRGPLRISSFSDTGTKLGSKKLAIRAVEDVTCTAGQVVFVAAGKRRPYLVRFKVPATAPRTG